MLRPSTKIRLFHSIEPKIFSMSGENWNRSKLFDKKKFKKVIGMLRKEFFEPII